MRPVYVETVIRAPAALVWVRSQDPATHQRWDVRFSRIEPAGPDGRFRYATRLLPGLTIAGYGIAAGERRRPDGTATSVLRFACTHPLSLIRSGSGYWRYVPVPGGARFLTGYDYTPGWRGAGRLADHLFRPLIGWATAWSFDRFRLWLETGRAPEHLRRRALAEVAARLGAVAAVTLALTTQSVALGSAAGLAAAAVTLLVPPLPGTPAARRCRRHPPDARCARPPRALDRLDRP